MLHYKPGGELLGEHYFNRKKRYAIDLCAVCDSNKKITYMLTGYSNAMHDARVWSQTRIHQNALSYLSPSQYLLGDAAYTPTSHMVLPYKALEANRIENTTFNKQLSHIRIDVEHTLGILKGRWRSLTGLSLILTSEKKYEFACMWITVCVVLHNILIDIHDEWSEKKGWWSTEDEEEHDVQLLNLSQREQM